MKCQLLATDVSGFVQTIRRKVLSMSFFVQIALLSAITIGSTVGALAQEAESTASTEAPNGNAILVNLSQPVYPSLARQANIHGEVAVAVTIHPDRKTEVALESGHPMLAQAALDSAKQSQFECRGCDSAVSYRLVYSFRLTHGSDCCSAFSVPAQVIREPQSSGQDGQRETHVAITAEEICLCDPAVQLTKRRSRSLKCMYLWKCS
jgi:Gram-negative bacterial TonB protein C-terminal